MVLGGVGVSLYDLVSFYVSFVNGGQQVSLYYWLQDIDSGFQIFSCFVVWQISYILFNILLLVGVLCGYLVYKIGISYGYCDVWVIGYDVCYVVGVWMGCLDGMFVSGVFGGEFVVLVLFDVFGLIKFDFEVFLFLLFEIFLLSYVVLLLFLCVFCGWQVLFEDSVGLQLVFFLNGVCFVLFCEGVIVKLCYGIFLFFVLVNDCVIF